MVTLGPSPRRFQGAGVRLRSSDAAIHVVFGVPRIGDLLQMIAGRHDGPDRASDGDDSVRRPVALGVGPSNFALRRRFFTELLRPSWSATHCGRQQAATTGRTERLKVTTRPDALSRPALDVQIMSL